MNTKTQSGFTLLELMVTIFIVALVMGFGVPMMTQQMQGSRMASNVNDFVAAMHLAKAEAIKQRTPVTVCSSADALSGTPTCSGNNFGTGEGWVVFVDNNDGDANGFGDGDIIVDPGEQIIQVHGPISANMTMQGNGPYVSFGGNGFSRTFLAAGIPATNLRLCDTRGNVDIDGNGTSAARVVAVSPTGRPQTFRDMVTVAATMGGCP